jgi:4-diphosphocytidyl-2-C-methyl-D-erythritol kinase
MTAQLTVAVPAKLNLGLEIVGRRTDGYHEIVTIMQTVSIFDRLTIEATEPGASVSLDVDWPELAGEENLVLRAARLLRERVAVGTGAHLDLRKSIPAAAGLGGASSDAAATLRAAAVLWSLSSSAVSLPDLAAELGSDVPFFLRGGTALTEGRGERLTKLPPLVDLWFVVVVPALAAPIPRKTATLYAMLSATDFSSGERVRSQAAALTAGRKVDTDLLDNPFLRPLYWLRPELADLQSEMVRSGAMHVALAGAGPAHYSVFVDQGEAERLAGKLTTRLGDRVRIIVCRPVTSAPKITSV